MEVGEDFEQAVCIGESPERPEAPGAEQEEQDLGCEGCHGCQCCGLWMDGEGGLGRSIRVEGRVRRTLALYGFGTRVGVERRAEEDAVLPPRKQPKGLYSR